MLAQFWHRDASASCLPFSGGLVSQAQDHEAFQRLNIILR